MSAGLLGVNLRVSFISFLEEVQANSAIIREGDSYTEGGFLVTNEAGTHI